jgi:hypothetical protein
MPIIATKSPKHKNSQNTITLINNLLCDFVYLYFSGIIWKLDFLEQAQIFNF